MIKLNPGLIADTTSSLEMKQAYSDIPGAYTNFSALTLVTV